MCLRTSLQADHGKSTRLWGLVQTRRHTSWQAHGPADEPYH